MNSPLNRHSEPYFNHPDAALAKTLRRWPWVLLIAFAICLLKALGAVKLWEHRDGSAGIGSLTIFDARGDVFVTGFSGTNQYSSRHAAADGGVVWKSMDDRDVSSVKLDRRGDFVVTGSIAFLTNGTSVSEMFTAKRSATNGSILWESRLGGDGAGGVAVAVDSNEDVMAAGHVASIEVLLAKYRGTDGQLVWQRRVPTPNKGRGGALWVALDKEQNAIIGGSFDNQFFVGKYSGADGGLLWEKQVPVNSRWYAPCVMGKVDSQGDVIATGGSFQEVYTAKFRGHDGSLVWERKLSASQRDNAVATSVERDAHGNAVVAATYSDRLNGEIGTVLVVKYGANDGATIWERRINKQLVRLVPVGLAVDTAQDVVLGVAEQRVGLEVAPARSLLKLDSMDGTILWEMPLGDFLPLGIAVGSDGRIAVAGKQTNAVTMLFQDEPRPRLQLFSTKNGAFQVRWPEFHRGLRLEIQDRSTGISSNGWTTVTNPGANSVDVPLQGGSKAGFFRLVRP